MKITPSIAVAGILCALAISVFAIGGERVSLWSYCRWWHSTSNGQVSAVGLAFVVPQGWCPLDAGEEVTLTSVPSSRSDESIVALIGALPRSLGERLPQLPERTELRGEALVLASEPLRHDLSGLQAFRMQYEPERSDAIAESYVAWLFPEERLMISSWVPSRKLVFFDDFVRALVEHAGLKSRVDTGSRGSPNDP